MRFHYQGRFSGDEADLPRRDPLPAGAFLANPALVGVGVFGAMSIIAASGDFINVFNALMQMPAGSLTFLSGMHSYWYLPSSE